MSTFTLVSTIQTDIRTEIQEATAHKWTAAWLLKKTNHWHRKMLARLQSYNIGWGITTEEFTVAASGVTYTLSGLTETNGKFKSVHKLWHVPTGLAPVPMDPMNETQVEQYRLDGGGNVSPQTTPGYTFRREAQTETLLILPPASATRTFKMSYFYEGPELTAGQQLHTPLDYDFLLVALVARDALRIKGLSNEDIEADIARGWMQMDDEQVRARNQADMNLIGSEVAEAFWTADEAF